MTLLDGHAVKYLDDEGFFKLLAMCIKLMLNKNNYNETLIEVKYFTEENIYYDLDKNLLMKYTFDKYNESLINDDAFDDNILAKDIIRFSKYFNKPQSKKFIRKWSNRLYKDSRKYIRKYHKSDVDRKITSVRILKSLIILCYLTNPSLRIPLIKFESKILAKATNSEKELLLKYYKVQDNYYILYNKDKTYTKSLQKMIIHLLHK